MMLAAIRALIRDRLLRLTGFEIKSEYVSDAPSHQRALDIFAGEWASRIPGPYTSGEHELFSDSRLSWLLDQLGSITGWRVLDCGPLEGGHSYSLERAGAEVLAIEANTRAFLRCLVAKEVLEMRTRFMLGNFLEVLKTPGNTFDMVVASGVLYHLTDPVTAIAEAARSTRRLYLWTHYYDSRHVSRALRFDAPFIHNVHGCEHRLHRQYYQTKIGNRAFFGGAENSSCWMEREELLEALAFFGFDDVRVHFDNKETSPGPSIALLATNTQGDHHRARRPHEMRSSHLT